MEVSRFRENRAIYVYLKIPGNKPRKYWAQMQIVEGEKKKQSEENDGQQDSPTRQFERRARSAQQSNRTKCHRTACTSVARWNTGKSSKTAEAPMNYKLANKAPEATHREKRAGNSGAGRSGSGGRDSRCSGRVAEAPSMWDVYPVACFGDAPLGSK